MSVKPESLENPERDLALETRENTRRFSRKVEEVEAELQALRQLRDRLATAKATARPKDTAPHCSDCFARGWAAAVRAIGGS
jgi:predicted phage gp36 major capsid-like protein